MPTEVQAYAQYLWLRIIHILDAITPRMVPPLRASTDLVEGIPSRLPCLHIDDIPTVQAQQDDAQRLKVEINKLIHEYREQPSSSRSSSSPRSTARENEALRQEIAELKHRVMALSGYAPTVPTAYAPTMHTAYPPMVPTAYAPRVPTAYVPTAPTPNVPTIYDPTGVSAPDDRHQSYAGFRPPQAALSPTRNRNAYHTPPSMPTVPALPTGSVILGAQAILPAATTPTFASPPMTPTAPTTIPGFGTIPAAPSSTTVSIFREAEHYALSPLPTANEFEGWRNHCFATLESRSSDPMATSQWLSQLDDKLNIGDLKVPPEMTSINYKFYAALTGVLAKGNVGTRLSKLLKAQVPRGHGIAAFAIIQKDFNYTITNLESRAHSTLVSMHLQNSPTGLDDFLANWQSTLEDLTGTPSYPSDVILVSLFTNKFNDSEKMRTNVHMQSVSSVFSAWRSSYPNPNVNGAYEALFSAVVTHAQRLRDDRSLKTVGKGAGAYGEDKGKGKNGKAKGDDKGQKGKDKGAGAKGKGNASDSAQLNCDPAHGGCGGKNHVSRDCFLNPKSPKYKPDYAKRKADKDAAAKGTSVSSGGASIGVGNSLQTTCSDVRNSAEFQQWRAQRHGIGGAGAGTGFMATSLMAVTTMAAILDSGASQCIVGLL